ncbi:unnamed protein product [Phytomonas sp. Hart1]|nr:unnamed protein product [Phytomonas sp. Hart1]|eukprot:CCW66354.1 unnamed protein product [Phytomonas sp. isolate Hart1]
MLRRCTTRCVPKTMKAAVFKGKNRIVLDEKPVPVPKHSEALIKITTTTICGTDIHILKGEYPVAEGLTIGHEPIGVIESFGEGVTGFKKGQRIVVGAITPCSSCFSCLQGIRSQCGSKLMGGWRFGNTIDGSQAEYLIIPDAMANMYPVPDGITDEQILMCPDIMSTGFSGPESANVKVGDCVVIYAQGPIGLGATAGAKMMGATKIIVVDRFPERLALAKKLGADHALDFTKCNPVEEVMRLTEGRGVDVAIEALGLQSTFEGCLRCLKPGGVLSSLGVYSEDLKLPLDAFAAGLGDFKIVTTLCPGGKERMRRLLSVIESGRVDMRPMVTHTFKLDDIEKAYDIFGGQRDGVLKVAIKP